MKKIFLVFASLILLNINMYSTTIGEYNYYNGNSFFGEEILIQSDQDIELEHNGIKIYIERNSFVHKNDDKLYQGKVHVTLENNPDITNELKASDVLFAYEINKFNFIESYGSVGIEVIATNDEFSDINIPLKLAKDKTIKISFPKNMNFKDTKSLSLFKYDSKTYDEINDIQESMKNNKELTNYYENNSNDFININFDQHGYQDTKYVEETLISSNEADDIYTIEVPRTGISNLAFKNPSVNLKGKILDDKGNASSFAKVYVKFKQNTYFVGTNDKGEFSIDIIKDEKIQLFARLNNNLTKDIESQYSQNTKLSEPLILNKNKNNILRFITLKIPYFIDSKVKIINITEKLELINQNSLDFNIYSAAQNVGKDKIAYPNNHYYQFKMLIKNNEDTELLIYRFLGSVEGDPISIKIPKNIKGNFYETEEINLNTGLESFYSYYFDHFK